MLQVLEPLEVADGDTAGVAEYVGQELHSLGQEDFLCSLSGGSVGGLNDQLAVELVGVVYVDRLLECGRNENITELWTSYHYL